MSDEYDHMSSEDELSDVEEVTTTTKKKKTAAPKRNSEDAELKPLDEVMASDNTVKRAKLHEMFKQVEGLMETNRDDIANPNCGKAEEIITTLDHNLGNIAHSRDLLHDSTLIKNVTKLVSEQAGKIGKASTSVNPTSLRTKLTARYPNSSDFITMGKDLAVFFAGVPTFNVMLGPLDVEIKKKERVVREKVTKTQPSGPKLQPHEITAEEDEAVRAGGAAAEDEFNAFKPLMKEMTECLLVKNPQTNKHEPISVCMFKLVVNPKSFSQTVENINVLQHFVKEGNVLVSIDETTGLPMVKAMGPTEIAQYKEKNGKKVDKQMVMSLSQEDFKQIIAVYEIKEGLLKDRAVVHNSNGGGTTTTSTTTNTRSNQTRGRKSDVGGSATTTTTTVSPSESPSEIALVVADDDM